MSEDSDTLLDAILDMNIVKKSEKSNGSQDSTPREGFQVQNGRYAVQSQMRSPKASMLIEEALHMLSSPQLGKHAHRTHVLHGAVDEALLFSDQQTPLTPQEPNGSIGRCDRKRKDSVSGLFIYKRPDITLYI